MGDKDIACLLDHFLVSESIMMNGGELKVSVLPSARSDHWPIKLEWDNVGTNLRRPFRFEIFWLDHPDFQPLIQQWWKDFHPSEGTPIY